MTTDYRITARVALGVAIGLAVLVGMGQRAPIRPRDSQGRNASHQADPCVHPPNPPGNAGNAKRIAKHCPPGGGSSGVAKDAFNGGSPDRFGASLY